MKIFGYIYCIISTVVQWYNKYSCTDVQWYNKYSCTDKQWYNKYSCTDVQWYKTYSCTDEQWYNNNNNNNCLKSNIQCIEIRVQWTMHLGSSHMHVHAVTRVHAVTPKLVICIMYLTSI